MSNHPAPPLTRVRVGLALLAALLVTGLTACGGATPSPFGRYVALGDSYTAAPGVAPGAQGAGACGNSAVNYPRVLAATINATLTDVSCSGATTGDFTGSQQTQDGPVPPQLKAVTRGTRLVTIGIGGNDLDLAAYATGCVQDQSTCGTALASIQKAIAGLGAHVEATIRAVRRQAPRAKVVVVGYPQVVPSSGSCAELPIPEQYYSYVGAVMPALDHELQQAAKATRSAYADVLSASKGHDLCASDPWIAGISGTGAQPLHPNAEEQKAVAGLIATLVGS